jgi:hypothetical protein
MNLESGKPFTHTLDQHAAGHLGQALGGVIEMVVISA